MSSRTTLHALLVSLALVVAPGVVPARAAPATCAGVAATIVGTNGDDELTGTPGDDRVVGGMPYTAKGRAGDDVLIGSYADDVLLGGPGRDRVVGGRGDDRCRGEDLTGCERPASSLPEKLL